MDKILHQLERIKLAALRDEWRLVREQMEDACIAPEAALRAAREAFGEPPSWDDIAEHFKWYGKRAEATKTEEEALARVKEPFEARIAEIDAEEDQIIAVVGCRLYDDGSGEDFVCAVTGLPLLESDEVALVLRSALPSSPHNASRDCAIGERPVA